MQFTEIQKKLIKENVYANLGSDTTVSKDDIVEFANSYGLEFRKGIAKGKLLDMIFADPVLEDKFYDYFGEHIPISIFKIEEHLHLERKQIYDLAKLEVIKVVGKDKKGYDMYSIETLSMTKQQLEQKWEDKFQKGVNKLLVNLKTKEELEPFVEHISKTFEVGMVSKPFPNQYGDSNYAAFVTVRALNSVPTQDSSVDEEMYQYKENLRLKTQLATQKEYIAELKKEIHRLTREQDQSYYNSPAYERNMEQLQELKEFRIDNRVLKMKNEHLERELEQIKAKRSRAGRKRECSEQTIEKVFKLKEQGLSIRKIAAEVGVGSTLVHRILTDESYSKGVQIHTEGSKNEPQLKL